MNKYAERLLKEWRKHDGLIIACDFDDTISPYHFKSPEDMERYVLTIRLLKDCISYGCQVIIFTARDEPRYVAVRDYCKGVGLNITGININLPGLPYGNSKKIYANVYIDDRGGLEHSLEQLRYALNEIRNDRMREYMEQSNLEMKESLLPLAKDVASKTVGLELAHVQPLAKPTLFHMEPVYNSRPEWPGLDKTIKPKLDHSLSDSILGRIELIDDQAKLKKWRAMHEKVEIGDEIYAWDSGGWDQLAGRRGYLILRHRKEVIEVKLTAMS